MLYTEFMNRVCDTCIFTSEITGKSFIAPCYKVYMKEDGLDPKDVSDIEVTFEDVKEYMELEIKRRDALTDNLPNVVDWIADLVFNQAEVGIQQEANDIANDLIEYMKLKKELEVKKDLVGKEENKKISGFNFNKKEI